MTKTRLVGGNATYNVKGKTKIFANEIEINSNGPIDYYAQNYSYGDPEKRPVSKYADFNIDFELDTEEKTVVPFGILDFKNNPENPFFSFKYILRGNNIDSLDFKITDENNEIIYQMGYLKPVIINAPKKSLILFEAKKATQGPLISKTWDYRKIFEPYILAEPDYTKVGEYHLNWDGFDNNEIYDSTRFAGKKLKAQLTARKENKVKTKEVEFEVSYKEVNWVDVKIDRKAKRIDATLRVNLTDGGAEGLDCKTYTIDPEASYETFTPTNSSDPLAGVKITQCNWDKIPKIAIQHNRGQLPLQTRTKTFNELRDLALQGIDKYWSRTYERTYKKGTDINGEIWEIFVKSKYDKNGMTAPKIIYFTNSENKTFNRSHNFEGFRVLYYKTGYNYENDWKTYPKNTIVYNSQGWFFKKEVSSVNEFLDTSAHEIGHQLLFEYGGRDYSYTHKKSSHWSWIIQEPVPGTTYPKTGEIDIMKYVEERSIPADYYDRIILSKEDLLGLIWLTKIKIS